MPNQWNSVLEMVDSILQLKCEVHNTLKRIGHAELCLHTDELDFLSELVAFLKPFKELTDLFSSTMPTLSVIPLMKMRIRRNCLVEPGDDEKIKCIKKSVLANLDCRLPETETVKLHQLLDPETKDLLPRQEATRVIEDAINAATARGFITVGTPQSHASASASSSGSAVAMNSDEDEAGARRKRMRMELVNELRSQTPGRSNDSMVCIIHFVNISLFLFFYCILSLSS